VLNQFAFLQGKILLSSALLAQRQHSGKESYSTQPGKSSEFPVVSLGPWPEKTFLRIAVLSLAPPAGAICSLMIPHAAAVSKYYAFDMSLIIHC
jgi:hypothetical protein